MRLAAAAAAALCGAQLGCAGGAFAIPPHPRHHRWHQGRGRGGAGGGGGDNAGGHPVLNPAQGVGQGGGG